MEACLSNVCFLIKILDIAKNRYFLPTYLIDCLPTSLGIVELRLNKTECPYSAVSALRVASLRVVELGPSVKFRTEYPYSAVLGNFVSRLWLSGFLVHRRKMKNKMN